MSGSCPQGDPRPCFKCNQTGHVARDCDQEVAGGAGVGYRGFKGSNRGFRGNSFRSSRSFGTGANSIALGPKKAKGDAKSDK